MGDVMSFFAELGAWNWLIAAVGLFILEIFAPGVFLLWFGVAAAIVGLLTTVFEIPILWQAILFAIAAIASVLVGRHLFPYTEQVSDQSSLNLRGHQYVGRTFTLEQPIVEGRGRLRVGDSLWSAEGPDLAAGNRVRVTGIKGTVLVVERL
jgi:membrane protein implicated in regulation of membrane protease activity